MPGSPTGGVGTAVSVAVVPVGVSVVTEPLGASPVADVPAAELVCGDVTDPGAPACCVRRKLFPSLARAIHPVSVIDDDSAACLSPGFGASARMA